METAFVRLESLTYFGSGYAGIGAKREAGANTQNYRIACLDAGVCGRF